jgi:hypothetical protein
MQRIAGLPIERLDLLQVAAGHPAQLRACAPLCRIPDYAEWL